MAVERRLFLQSHDGGRGMTHSFGPAAHVLTAGLALVAGYGAAAFAGSGRGEAAPVPAVFGTVTSGVHGSAGADPSFMRARYLPGRIVSSAERATGDQADRGRHQVTSLVWAAVPPVPATLSAKETSEAPREPTTSARSPGLSATRVADSKTKTRRADAPMPVLTTLAERMGLEGIGAQMLEDNPIFAAKRKRSEPGRLPMSRSRALDHVYSHAGDPLAVLQLDDDQSAPEFIMPFANGRVTSLFNQGRRHPAIDLAGKLGSPVLATTSRQKIIFAGPRGGYGNAVITSDPFGRTHLYGHLQKITSSVGQMLEQGDKLGHLGSTGHSTGPHVHYEVKAPNGVHINPVTLLFPGRGVSKGYAWLDVRQESVLARVAARTR
jgi:murein DD-endopeptidase MepM/ murein hydrolase activator NlpD